MNIIPRNGNFILHIDEQIKLLSRKVTDEVLHSGKRICWLCDRNEKQRYQQLIGYYKSLEIK